MEILEYPDREFLALAVADVIGSALARQLRVDDRASLCLPGGSTPQPVYHALSSAQLDWSKVTVLLGDERWVPEIDPRSNSGMLRRGLLQGPAAAASYLDLYTGADRPEDAEAPLAARVEALLPLTVTLLGMGDDMHTASLFPGMPRLAEALAADAPPVLAMRGGAAPEPRISLSARVLKNSLGLHLMITGAAKREALDIARKLTPEDAPIAAFLGDLTVHWAE